MSKKATTPMQSMGKVEQNIFLEVTVDGKKSNLGAKITFNLDKGTGDVTMKLTTKHMSFDETEKEYVMEQLQILAGVGYDKVTRLIKATLDAQGPEAHGQLNAFSGLIEQEKEEATRTRKKNTAKDVKTAGDNLEEVNVMATSSTDG